MDDSLPFEKAFERLEEILEKMNGGEVTLDDSISLYEEADRLITQCSKKLEGAEEKIEKLMKSKEKQVELDEEGNPILDTFETVSGDVTP